MASIVELIQGFRLRYMNACQNIDILNSKIREIQKIKRDTKSKVPAKFRNTYSTQSYDRYIRELKRERALQELTKRDIENKIEKLAELWDRFT